MLQHASSQRSRPYWQGQAKIWNDVVLSDIHHLSVVLWLPILPSRSEQVCLASSDLLHMHLALAGTRFSYYYCYVHTQSTKSNNNN